MDLQDMSCCGLGEISGVSALTGYGRQTAEDLFYDLCVDQHNGSDTGSFFDKGALIFTQAGNKNTKYGHKFAAFIEENKLGTVTVVPTFTNPNTKNTITTFVWKINDRNVRRLYRKLQKARGEVRPQRSGSFSDRYESDYYSD